MSTSYAYTSADWADRRCWVTANIQQTDAKWSQIDTHVHKTDRKNTALITIHNLSLHDFTAPEVGYGGGHELAKRGGVTVGVAHGHLHAGVAHDGYARVVRHVRPCGHRGHPVLWPSGS